MSNSIYFLNKFLNKENLSSFSCTNSVSSSKIIVPTSLLRLDKLNLMMKIMERKTNNPNYKQKQVAKLLGCSDSTIGGYIELI